MDKTIEIKYWQIIVGVLGIILLWNVGSYFLLPKPPARPDDSLLTGEVEFLDPAWQALEIKSICLGGEISMPQGQEASNTYTYLTKLFQGIGIRVLPLGSACDASLTINLSGRGIAGYYSGKSCTTGYSFSGEMVLSAEGLEDQVFRGRDHNDPPPSVSESNCAGFYSTPLNHVWLKFMREWIASTWNEAIFYHFYQTVEKNINLGGFPCMSFPAKPEFVPIIIPILMEHEETPSGTCISKLGEIGPEAKEAVPYLMYLLGTADDHVSSTKPDIYSALQEITGEDLDNTNAWWRWWADQQEQN